MSTLAGTKKPSALGDSQSRPLDHADEYTDPGSATLMRAELDAATLTLSITDAGRPAGTGLGLAIARGGFAAMGGVIRAESPSVPVMATGS